MSNQKRVDSRSTKNYNKIEKIIEEIKDSYTKTLWSHFEYEKMFEVFKPINFYHLTKEQKAVIFDLGLSMKDIYASQVETDTPCYKIGCGKLSKYKMSLETFQEFIKHEIIVLEGGE